MTSHHLRTDAALAVACSAWQIVGWTASGSVPVGWWALPVAAAMFLPAAPLAWRRSRPWASFCGVAAAYCVWLPTVGHRTSVQIAAVFVLISLYSVSRWAVPRRGRAAAGVAAAVLAVPELARTVGRDRDAVEGAVLTLFLIGIPLCVWLAGDGRRRAREDAARLRELAARLRAEQERSARHAVRVERARIAGDLHDVVASQVSAIAIAARTGPPGEHARLIATTADQALAEMRRMIGLLTDGAERTEPAASLADLDRLIKVVEASGCRVAGPPSLPTGLGPATETSVYRILQEALTNVVKHAGPTDVEITMTESPLTVTVTNGPEVPGHRPGSDSAHGSGLGLIGLRERAALYGGTLEAGPHQGGWRVRAVLPAAGAR
ncbi:sensor histidine kinase [Actinomadura soli]|uniref:histidine kinase n=1 Tax=Actinomadura soli TaxID=2508997 RepID=A0A5C4JG75_9ACTN|nr:ATP-binding protein [Actinomadura soli]TMR04321.1 sensor histidine kinase [Actinomadura soli]